MREVMRPVAGLATVVAIVAIVCGAAVLFQGGLKDEVPLTVISQRAGLVMNPDAKVKLLGVQVGSVSSIEDRPNGQAAIHLAMDPDRLADIPANVLVDVASPTVFGAKSVELRPPADPSPTALQPGQTITAEHVTVEFNTIFQQLTAVLSKIQPEKLSETLGAISSAFEGRGEQFGKTVEDLNTVLGKLEPSLPNLSRDIELAVPVLDTYADATPDLLTTIENTSHLSRTIVDKQPALDDFLLSMIGLADVGNDVIGSNEPALADAVHLLAPTVDLTNRYNAALNCGIAGLARIADTPPLPKPGTVVSVNFELGVERYRYPNDLPKVAAKGGPQCAYLPDVPMNARPPFVVADVGANPWQYGNQGLLLNADGLKQMLFGPLEGPPRNSAQIGEPG